MKLLDQFLFDPNLHKYEEEHFATATIQSRSDHAAETKKLKICVPMGHEVTRLPPSEIRVYIDDKKHYVTSFRNHEHAWVFELTKYKKPTQDARLEYSLTKCLLVLSKSSDVQSHMHEGNRLFNIEYLCIY